MKFHKAVVIYNPNSTGDSQANADTFKDELLAAGFKGEVELVGTQYAGHAEEIAEAFADPRAILVSSSGDGGYNEVVNGVIRAGNNTVVAVLPSGNANDHHTANTTGELIANIIKGTITTLETLRVEATVEGKPWTRYAHSYVGFGLTPKVGKVLTDKRPNVISEKWYVLRHAISFKYVTLLRDGQKRRYDNLIFAVISRMSKVVKLDPNAKGNDGLMEVYATHHLGLLAAIKTFYRAATSGIVPEKRIHAASVGTVRPTLVQLDGEVFRLDGNSEVMITCQKSIIQTIL